jgi:lysophospholipase L1-like esterase
MAIASRKVLFLASCTSLAVMLLLMLLVEFVAGFFVDPVRFQEIPGDAVSTALAHLDINPAPLVADVDLLWRNQPGARRTQPVIPQRFGSHDQWTLEVNSEGFRGPEREAPKPGGNVFRVLCVGDSITYGFNVDQPDAYPQQLGALLAARYAGRRFEVINAGVPGWSWLQGLRFLEARGLAVDPDVVVIGHGTNDQLFASKITDEERLLGLARPLDKAVEWLAVFASRTNTYRALAHAFGRHPEDSESRGCREQVRRWGGCHRVSVDEITSAVHEVSTLAAAHGIALVVVNTDFLRTPAIEGVKRGVDGDAIPFVDPVAEIERARRDDEDARASRLGLAPSVQSASVPGSATNARKVTLRVLVPEREHGYRLKGTSLYKPGFSFDEAVVDDGSMGDERAGDGVFSRTIEVPADFPAIEYQYYQDAAEEFPAPSPFGSRLGNRMLAIAGNGIAPVEVFGQSLLMIERAHPDRAGQRIIAEVVAAKLAELPSFRDYVSARPPL